MPRNGSGTYTAPANSFNPAVANTVIDPDDWDAILADLSTALTDSLDRTGDGAMEANLDMGTFSITNASAISATSLAVTSLTAATVNKVTITTPATAATLTIANNGSLITSGAFPLTLTATATTNSTFPGGTHTLAGLDVVQTWSANQSFNSGNFLLKGSASGSITVNATATASGTITFPATTDVVVLNAATATLTNKTISGSNNTLSNIATSSLTGSISAANGGTGVAVQIPLLQSTTISVNFNSGSTDNAIAITMPSGYTRFIPFNIHISHASASLTTSTFGVFTATGGGGALIVSAGTANTVSATADATANNAQTITTGTNTSFVSASLATANTIYFRINTPQGSAATGDVTFTYFVLP